jgi:ketosteroid isomerase-like protein
MTPGVSDDGATVFRRFHEAWTQGDLDAVFRLVEPDVVVRPLHGAMFTRMEFRGRDGIAQWYREMTEPWDRFEVIVEDVRENPRHEVLGVVCLVGYRGDDGFHARVGVVVELRDGRIATLTARNVAGVERQLSAD